MKQFIFGTTDLAELLLYNLKQQKMDIAGFVVEQQYKTSDCLDSYPIYSWEEFQVLFKPEACGLYICIGYVGMNAHRRRIFKMIKGAGYRILEYVSPQAYLMSEKRGEGCLIFEGSYLGPYAVLGDGNILYPRCVVAHHTVVGDFNYFAISASIAGKVKVGDECFFGNNCSTKDKITIGDRVLVGAGAYVYKDMMERQVIVPAKSVVRTDRVSTDYM